MGQIILAKKYYQAFINPNAQPNIFSVALLLVFAFVITLFPTIM